MSLHWSFSGGTELTQMLAVTLGKPWMHVYADLGVDQAVRQVEAFLSGAPVEILNVAGPRESEEPEAGRFAMDVLSRLWP